MQSAVYTDRSRVWSRVWLLLLGVVFGGFGGFEAVLGFRPTISVFETLAAVQVFFFFRRAFYYKEGNASVNSSSARTPALTPGH